MVLSIRFGDRNRAPGRIDLGDEFFEGKGLEVVFVHLM